MAPPLLSALMTIAPHLVIQLNDVGTRSVVMGRDEAMVRCVEAGLELQFQFETELCRKRSFWFDSCGGERKEIASLRYEPVSDVFIVRRDRFGDGLEGTVARFMSAEDGLNEASVSNPFLYTTLAHNKEKLLSSERRYLRARAVVACKEERDRTLDRVTEGLTFGLVKRDGFDSGWRERKVESSSETDDKKVKK